MDKVRVLIDTDLGDDVDDAAALMLALSWGGIEIAGVTTVFKDTVKRAEMVEDLLELYGREDIPVCAGYGGSIIERSFSGGEEPIQYGILKDKGKGCQGTGKADNDRTGRTEESKMVRADDFIIGKVKEDPGLVILAMGAMTNLAMAFLREPEVMGRVKIIGMGGSFMNSSPEWNIICDPEAASIVMEKSENLIMMGLDVTKYLRIEEKRLTAWKAKGDIRLDYFLKGLKMFRDATGFPITFHDVLLIAYLMDERVVSLKRGCFAVELSGKLTRGTMVDMTNYYEINPEVEHGFQFAGSVDLERFYRIVDEHF